MPSVDALRAEAVASLGNSPSIWRHRLAGQASASNCLYLPNKDQLTRAHRNALFVFLKPSSYKTYISTFLSEHDFHASLFAATYARRRATLRTCSVAYYCPDYLLMTSRPQICAIQPGGARAHTRRSFPSHAAQTRSVGKLRASRPTRRLVRD